MKRYIHIYTFPIILIFFCIPYGANAQENTSDNKSIFALETDPSAFVFNGYAFHFRFKPKKAKHILVGMGTYGLDLPEIMIDMNKKNKNQGWNVRINSAFSIFGEYYFSKANFNWFTGMQIGIQNFKLRNEKFSGSTTHFKNLILMPSIGYNWKPFSNAFYLKPWLGLGYNSILSGNQRIEDHHYDLGSLVPFLTLHVGYSF